MTMSNNIPLNVHDHETAQEAVREIGSLLAQSLPSPTPSAEPDMVYAWVMGVLLTLRHPAWSAMLLEHLGDAPAAVELAEMIVQKYPVRTI